MAYNFESPQIPPKHFFVCLKELKLHMRITFFLSSICDLCLPSPSLCSSSQKKNAWMVECLENLHLEPGQHFVQDHYNPSCISAILWLPLKHGCNLRGNGSLFVFLLAERKLHSFQKLMAGLHSYLQPRNSS